MKRLDVPVRNLVLWAAFAVLALWPALFDSPIHLSVFGFAFFYGALALAWNVSALTGVLSLGHAIYFGLGAYGAAIVDHHWQVSPWLTLLLGGAAGATVGVFLALLFKNLRGASYALATLAAVEVPKGIADNWESVTFGSLGIVGIRPFPAWHFGSWSLDFGESLKAQYYLLLSLMILFGWVHYLAVHSRWGWAIRAVREDESAAAALGVDVLGVRTQAALVSGFLTGVCGGIYAHLLGLIEPPLVFSLHVSALPLVLCIFGGRFRFYGPLVGALILYPTDQLLFHTLFPVGHAALYGMVIVLVILFFPGGVGAWVQRRRRPA